MKENYDTLDQVNGLNYVQLSPISFLQRAAAVVAKPDEKWGETPCAFVELKAGMESSEQEVIAFCRENMAGYKRPKQVIFIELPKTPTGKIQKFKLREMVAAGEV